MEHLEAIHPIGTPNQCIERLLATAERSGIRHVRLLVEGAGDPRRTQENIVRH